MSRGVEPTETFGADALAELHRAHYAALVRLAALLLGDRARSEEVVQDAFVRLAMRTGRCGTPRGPRPTCAARS